MAYIKDVPTIRVSFSRKGLRGQLSPPFADTSNDLATSSGAGTHDVANKYKHVPPCSEHRLVLMDECVQTHKKATFSS